MLIASGAEFEVTGILHSASPLRMRVEMVQSAVPAGVELRSGAERIAGVVRVIGLLVDRPCPCFQTSGGGWLDRRALAKQHETHQNQG